ncbi:MAG: C25 family cysteine peptidase [Pseudobdellovibrio sp.]
MKLKLILSLSLLIGLTAQANQRIKINVDKNNLSVNSIEAQQQAFLKVNLKGFETDKTVGAPELPVKSWLMKGTPQQIKINLKANQIESFDGKPFPTQEQDCRCITAQVKTFQLNNNLYSQSAQNITVSYLGAYRGTPISKVDFRLGTYNQERNQVDVITNAELEISADEFSLPKDGDLKNYLILGPADLLAGTTDFVNWKRSQGYHVSLETISSPNNTTAGVQALIKKYYTDKIADFVMIIGDETTVPMFRVATSGSAQTPSDLQYYTMDGPQDNIPDVFGSRIVATNAEQVTAQLAKSIEFEQKAYGNKAGLNKFIGIASNEGSNPSDDQYVKGIEDKFKEVLNSNIVHLQQNDAGSTPATLNSNFESGAAWLTYVGHGSGVSWPSMKQTYSTANVKQINNKNSVKPIIIDVACQNGRLITSNLGSSFMRADAFSSNFAFGAVAYYGGSVNVSWHPPAIMAQGIAFEHLTKKYAHLGQALLAGQLYMASKWTNQTEVVDNFEWYHLQGDPGLNISF